MDDKVDNSRGTSYDSNGYNESEIGEDDYMLRDSTDRSLGLKAISYQRRGLLKWIVAFNCALFAVSLGLFLFSTIKLRNSSINTQTRNWILRATSRPSPLFDQIDIPLLKKRVNGTLLEPISGFKDIFRQPPSPDVDAAWERIQTRNPVPVSRRDVLNLGKDPNRVAKFPESFGFGPEAYIGKVDVFHQIHCLNTLRMNLRNNFDYYYGDEFPDGAPTDRFHDLHVSHCLSVLLQNLKCASSVDIYTHTWIDAQIHAFPDFNINHQCRDFDAILAWQETHAVPLEKFADIRAPDDFPVHIMSHEFKEVFNWYSDHPDDNVQGGESF